jgi:tetrahydromethanopterin S-methyltransferase subunit F
MNDAAPAVTRRSATLIGTLVAGSFGLAAGIALAFLIVAALLRVS